MFLLCYIFCVQVACCTLRILLSVSCCFCVAVALVPFFFVHVCYLSKGGRHQCRKTAPEAATKRSTTERLVFQLATPGTQCAFCLRLFTKHAQKSHSYYSTKRSLCEVRLKECSTANGEQKTTEANHFQEIQRLIAEGLLQVPRQSRNLRQVRRSQDCGSLKFCRDVLSLPLT